MKITTKPSVKKLTTLNIGGIAQKEYLLEKKEDAEKLSELLYKDCLPFIFIGGGSNILVKDGSLECVLIRDMIGSKAPIEIIEEDEHYSYVLISSGVYLPLFISYCGRLGLSGLEGLTGIPGRMGGAVAMNAGAFSCQISDVFESAMIFSPEFGLKKYEKKDVNFGYRHFSLKEETSFFICTEMTFKMKRSFPDRVEQIIKENFAKKQLSQPLTQKTAGCAFKNPEGHSAGKLIQDAGLKDYRINDMGFNAMHANFLTNYAQGTYSDAMELLDLAKERVHEKFNIVLEREIKVLDTTSTFFAA